MYNLQCSKDILIIKYPNGDSQMFQCKWLSACEHSDRVNIMINARIIATAKYSEYVLNGESYDSAESLLAALQDAFHSIDVNVVSIDEEVEVEFAQRVVEGVQEGVNVSSMDETVIQAFSDKVVEGIGSELTVNDISDEAADKISTKVVDSLGDDFTVKVSEGGIVPESLMPAVYDQLASVVYYKLRDDGLNVGLVDGAITETTIDPTGADCIAQAVKDKLSEDFGVVIAEAGIAPESFTAEAVDLIANRVVELFGESSEVSLKEGAIDSSAFTVSALSMIRQAVDELSDGSKIKVDADVEISDHQIEIIAEKVAESVGDDITVSVKDGAITADTFSDDAVEEIASAVVDAMGSDMDVNIKENGITAESFTTEALQAIADTTIASMPDEPATLQDGAVNLESVDLLVFDKIREAVDEIVDPVTGEKSRIKVDTDIEISEEQVAQIADKTAEAIIPAIAEGIIIKEGGINADSFGADALESIAQSVSEKMADEGESAIKEGGITSESFSSDALASIADAVADAVVEGMADAGETSIVDGGITADSLDSTALDAIATSVIEGMVDVEVGLKEGAITAESLSEGALDAVSTSVGYKIATVLDDGVLVSSIDTDVLDSIGEMVLNKIKDRDIYCTEAEYTAWASAGSLDPTKRYFICED